MTESSPPLVAPGAIADLLAAALDQPAAERRGWLTGQPLDPALIAEVLALLDAAEHAPAWLAAPADGLPAGTQIGPFRIVRELGRGGMGVVYLVEREQGGFRQHAALKVLPAALDSPERRARFIAERQILAELEHPNIARLLDGGFSQEQRPWFALELIQGEPITDYCRRLQLDIPARLRLLLQLCSAVGYAHAQLLVHRDLKPGNILVDASGRLRLLDFGIAKPLGPEPADGRPESLILTPAYAAPELLRGERVTTAADVWSIGIVLYELLTDQRPFPVSGNALIEAILGGSVPPPSRACGRRARYLRGDLDAIMHRATAATAARRYASVDALAEDLRRYLARMPVHAHADSAAYRIGKYLRRHPIAVLASSLALAILSATAVGLYWQAERAAGEARRARLITDFVTGLFEIANPDVSQGRTVEARELLSEGAKRMQHNLSGDPTLAVELARVVGKLSRQVGDYSAAEAVLREALSYGAAMGATTRAAVRIELGESLILDGQYASARESLQTALAEVPLRTSSLRAQALARLGQAQAMLGEIESGTGLVRAALATDLAVAGLDSEEVIRDQHLLGEIAYEAQRFDTAAMYYRAELAATAARHGESSTERAQAEHDLGVALAGAGELKEAQSHMQNACALRRKLLGEQHPALALCLRNWAGVLRQAGQSAAAEPKYREALAINERVLGPEHLNTFYSVNSLAVLLAGDGRVAEALPMFQRSLRGFRRTLGAEHPTTGVVLISLAALEARVGHYAEAEALNREAIALNDRKLGPDNPRSAVAKRALGYAIAMAGDAERALPYLRDAVRVHAAQFPDHHPELIVFRASLAQALAATPRLAEALAVARTSYDAAARALPASHPFRGYAALTLARVLIKRGQPNAARQILSAIDPLSPNASHYAPHFANEYRWLSLSARAASGDPQAARDLRRKAGTLRAGLPPLLAREVPLR